LDKAVTFLENTVANGGNVLLVGTKRRPRKSSARPLRRPTCLSALTAGSAARSELRDRKKIHRQVSRIPGHQPTANSSKYSRKEESAIKREMVAHAEELQRYC